MRLPIARPRRDREDGMVPRVYAIGDVHGRLDLFEELIGRIEADTLVRPPRPTCIVILGDIVDRGPDSAQIITVLMRLRRKSGVIVLKGNHEAIMVDALAGDHHALDLWLAHGGAATLRSFGIDEADIDADNSAVLLRLAQHAVPHKVRRWLAGLPTFVRVGAHYLVHAGIMPGVPLDDQVDADRLWISDEFTGSDADHGAVIVHGHTINEAGVVITPNRIGVDTGAYRTGRLSAVRLEEGEEVGILMADGGSARD